VICSSDEAARQHPFRVSETMDPPPDGQKTPNDIGDEFVLSFQGSGVGCQCLLRRLGVTQCADTQPDVDRRHLSVRSQVQRWGNWHVTYILAPELLLENSERYRPGRQLPNKLGRSWVIKSDSGSARVLANMLKVVVCHLDISHRTTLV
jgi:hypothetical protein